MGSHPMNGELAFIAIFENEISENVLKKKNVYPVFNK